MVDKKQKILVLDPKNKEGELGDQSVGTRKTIGYNYD
jgi:hypothetical protein